MPREKNAKGVEDVVVAVKAITEERRAQKRVKIREAINAAVFSKEKEKKEEAKVSEQTKQVVTEAPLERTLNKEEEKKAEKELSNLVDKAAEDLDIKPEVKKVKDESFYAGKSKDIYGREPDTGLYAKNDIYETHGAAARFNPHEQHTQQELYRKTELEHVKKQDAEHPKKMKTLFEQGKGGYVHG